MKKKDTQEILEAISRVEYRLGQRIDDVTGKCSIFVLCFPVSSPT